MTGRALGFVRRYGLVLLIAAMAVNLVRLQLHNRTHAEQSAAVPVILPPAPFSAYTVVLQETTSTAGSTKAGARLATAVRTDGASVELFEYLAPNEHGKRVVQRIIRHPDGRRVDANDITEMAFAARELRNLDGGMLRDPRTQCLRDRSGMPVTSTQKQLGIEVVDGWKAYVVEEGATTSWFAADLDCALVRSITKTGPDAISQKDLVRISPGFADPALFEIPLHYQEKPPSEVFGASSSRAVVLDNWYASAKLALHPTVP